MKPLKIDHIGVAVRSIEKALGPFAALGLAPTVREELPHRGVRVACLPVGETRIELVEPLGPDAAVAKFLDKRGEGLHHIALAVADIDVALGELKAAGVRLIDETPKSGMGGRRIAFVHPEGMSGVMVELVETPTSGGLQP